jgi:hypothetical protein
MDTTNSGLLVPYGTIDKTREALAPFETAAFKHAAEILLKHHLALIVICRTCAEHGRNYQMSIAPDATGTLVAECDCRELHFVGRKRRGAPQRVKK